jgi:hypothetical protein
MSKMKKNKLRILALTLVTILIQGTCTYAATSSKDPEYTKDELNNLTPGFEPTDIDKSNYKVNSYKNSFSSAQTPSVDNSTSNTSTNTSSTTTNTTVNTNANSGNVIVSTSPSTGNKGDFWGKTTDGKWILIEQGVPATGWRAVRGKWYYMDSDGVMQTGWLNDGENWYYLNSDGSMAYNTIVDGYYLDWSGAMQ